MRFTEIFIELANILAWPVAAILIALAFRAPLAQLFFGTGVFGKRHTEPTPTDQKDVPEAPTAEEQIKQTQAHLNPLVERWTQIIRQQLTNAEPLLKNLGVDKETALLQALAASNLQGHFERTYNVIWGSQIAVLQQLNTLNDVEEVALKSIYENARALYPALYSGDSFERWLAFLESQVLIERKDGRVSITQEGVEFMKYIIDRKYNAAKLG